MSGGFRIVSETLVTFVLYTNLKRTSHTYVLCHFCIDVLRTHLQPELYVLCANLC